jgi:pimeloyl-ACP methyl ester carboxylesterase
MLKLLLVPLLLYLAILVLLFVFQARLIFPASAAGGAPPLPAAAGRLVLRTPGGETLRGSHIPGAAGEGPVVLGFGGNAWNADAAALELHRLFPANDTIVFHYRGYAPSTGSPSARALAADALLVHDEAVRRFPGRGIVAIGFSVGSGVAAQLAAERPLAGLVLVTPFDDLGRVAAGHYPWLPVRWLFRHDLPAAERLAGSRVPTAIVAGGRDTLIPPARTDALRRAVPNLVFDRTVAGAGHNDIYADPAFPPAMRAALAAVTGRSPAKAGASGS